MRVHLIFGTITLLLLALTISYHKRKPFGFENVQIMARDLSVQAYTAAPDILPRELKKLNYDQVRDIRWSDKFALWKDKGLPFQVKFFHLGGAYRSPVEIYTVEKKGSYIGRVVYSPRQFDFGKNNLRDPIPDDLGYSGFRVHFPINRKDYLDEAFVFQGASYFRSLAKDQIYGLSARGLAIDTIAKKDKEEFPAFTKFWLKEPSGNDNTMVFFALLDSPSVTGAYEFSVKPGQETEMKIRSTLYFRKDVNQLGIAPLTSMYWFGENSRPNIQDFRPEVHDSDGLLIQNANDEWIWRPLSNSAVPRESTIPRENTFVDAGTRGFGLLQRDRNFSNYQDLEAKYHLRPSAWVVPSNNWGKGAVHLIQFATKDEFMDNVVAFWMPEKPARRGDVLNFDYGLYWNWNSRNSPIAYATQTRIQYPVADEPGLVIIDFAGAELENRPFDQSLAVEVTSDPAEALREVFPVVKNDSDKTWRVSFSLNVQNLKKPIELRGRLMDNGKPMSETWTYTWKP